MKAGSAVKRSDQIKSGIRKYAGNAKDSPAPLRVPLVRYFISIVCSRSGPTESNSMDLPTSSPIRLT